VICLNVNFALKYLVWFAELDHNKIYEIEVSNSTDCEDYCHSGSEDM
jgi:hypothetical protein